MRARNIKPGFFENDELVEIGFGGRLLFIGLWTLADREGRLEDRPRKIKMQLFPADDVDVDPWLDDLQQHGFIERYLVGDLRLIQVVNFTKHQRPHQNEAPSVYPSVDGIWPEDASTSHQGNKPGEPRGEALRSDTLNTDSLNSDSLNADTSKTVPRAERAPSSEGVESPSVSNESEPDTPFGLFTVLCDVNGVEPASIAPIGRKKQLGIGKTLLEQGFSADKTRRCLLWLRSQEWRTGGIDLGTVLSEGPKWELAGCPATAEPRKRVSHGATGAPRRTGPSFDAAIEARQAATAPG